MIWFVLFVIVVTVSGSLEALLLNSQLSFDEIMNQLKSEFKLKSLNRNLVEGSFSAGLLPFNQLDFYFIPVRGLRRLP